MANVLKLRRSQPKQGQPVTVFFEGEGHVEHGRVTLPFDIWVAFSKILQQGVALNDIHKYYKLKIVIEGALQEELGKKIAGEVKTPPQKIRSLATANEEQQ